MTYSTITEHRSYHTQQEQTQNVPVRWRTNKDNERYEINNGQQINVDNRNIINSESSINFVQTKHEESRRRTIRIRTLTTLQNELRKELESNETMLTEYLKTDKDNLELRKIQMFVAAINNCVQKHERIQIELQKLYRDQIYEEKQLYGYYKQVRPTELNLHNQIKLAIDRWEMIYNQLLEMQLNEKRRNSERKQNYERILNELESKINDRTSTKQVHSYNHHHQSNPQQQILYSTYSPPTIQVTYSPKIIPTTYSPSISQQQIQSKQSVYESPTKIQTSQQQTKSPSYPQQTQSKQSSSNEPQSLSSWSYLSSSNGSSRKNTDYSSSLTKTSAFDHHSNSYMSSENAGIAKTQPFREENSLIFRRPEAPLKITQCLDKWFDDLGKQDAEWIISQQLKNEKLFEELVRLQKAQWDKLFVEHQKKKEEHIPHTFKCELESQTLCDQEEANFKKMFNQYRAESYPTKLTNSQQNLNHQNHHQQNYQPHNQQQRQTQQPIYLSN